MRIFVKLNTTTPRLSGAIGLGLLTFLTGCGEEAQQPRGQIPTNFNPGPPPSATMTAPGGFGGPSFGGGLQDRQATLSTPDYREKRTFRKDRASAEVLGICQMTEEKLVCWDASGNLDKKLESSMATRLSAYDGLEVPTKFQKRNRLIVVRHSMPSSRLDPDVRFVGAFFKRGEKLVSCTTRPLMFPDGKLRMTAETSFALSVPKDIQEVVQRFMVSEPIRDTAELSCEVGSEAKFYGKNLRVTAIDRVDGSTWSIAIDTGLNQRDLTLRFSVLDSKGRTIAWVDQSGKPFTEDEYSQRQRMDGKDEAGGNTMPGRPAFTRVGDLYTTRSPANQMRLVSRVDPQYVGKIAVSGRLSKLVEIGPVPLNPR